MSKSLFLSLLLTSALIARARVVGEGPRAPGDTALSGISYVGDGVYWAVDDGGKIVKGRVEFKTGDDGRCLPSWTRLDRFGCRGADDLEGIAYDRSDGSLWVADETGPAILHVDPKSMNVVGNVELPAVYRAIENNRGIEALAIDGDGLTMWTANEDVLPADDGSDCVRLQRFSRVSVTNAWSASGQWAYQLTVPQKVKKVKKRNGLAELCFTPSGGLLGLEREKARVKGTDEVVGFRLRVFRIETDGATDVSASVSLSSGGFTPVKKTPLCDLPTGKAMYEAITAGPKLPDGGDSYVLVSDGDKGCDEKVLVLTLP